MISFLSLLFLELLAVATITVSFSNGSTYVGCIQSEREALLRFKHDLNDSFNRLSSWDGVHGDCCKWDAVVCSNFTGHVLELHLGNPFSDYSSRAEIQAYLRSVLRGKISSSLLDLKHLVYLDLSYNDFKGVQIPRFLGSMRNLRIIDLSKNKFSGEIPMEVTNLHALISLNLSHNSFFGKIPESIGDMRDLETIDFSANLLSGKIPQSITSLTYLNHLNLSNNKLTGEIPLGTQLQSLDASSFNGNELCGFPLKNCTVATYPTPRNENGTQHEVDWFYVSMGLGFVVGFWSFIGPLLINRSFSSYLSFAFSSSSPLKDVEVSPIVLSENC
ncbi:hypothetical protein Dsin_023023 [Dipteronia sinensis]|uniref:Leucine-rich repeat-containing N-terminal plant-type domain-containing protein n=1 Tax=Dipteronia sinensis TaxID=43782 RepID=A0AAE0A2W1_9ROSI|nr:hypothetical protein Dsin_023023 [Dipteronia sinensis]